MFDRDNPFAMVSKGSGVDSVSGFGSPFRDLASLAMPTDPRNALRYCEFIWYSQGVYQQAHRRIISYFLTDLRISASDKRKSLPTDEREKWDHFINKQIQLPVVEYAMNLDLACYGNAFCSVHVPTSRFLICPKCQARVPFRKIANSPARKFKYSDGKFKASCGYCDHTGEFNVHDEVLNDPNSLKLKLWSVHEIYIKFDPYSEDMAYYWKIPDEYIQDVQRGDKFILERANLKVLEAIRRRELFRFEPDMLYHMKEPVLSGIRHRGWGISRILSSFRNIFHVQVLKKYNESYALDYVVPWRVITPAPKSGANDESSDPVFGTNLGDFRRAVDNMVQRRRRDPMSVFSLPFPVQYQVLGGEGNTMAPTDLLAAAEDSLLNATGIPADMYRGTMRLEFVPLAARSFEANWKYMVQGNDSFVMWVVSRCSKLLSWSTVDVQHERVTIADDIQKQLALLQLAAQGDSVSYTTALRPLGAQAREERHLRMEEMKDELRMQAEAEEDMESTAFMEQISKGQMQIQGGMPAVEGGDPTAAAQPGGGPLPPPAAGGAPPEGGAGPQMPMMPGGPPPGSVIATLAPDGIPQDIEGMQGLAQQVAQHLLYYTPESLRRSELHSIKEQNEMLHTLVTKALEALRQQNRSQGGAMMEEEQRAMAQQGAGGM